jgi:phage-related tail protein
MKVTNDSAPSYIHTGRMAELAVEGISGMNEVVSGQIAEMGEQLFETKRAHLALTQEVHANQQRLSQQMEAILRKLA